MRIILQLFIKWEKKMNTWFSIEQVLVERALLMTYGMKFHGFFPLNYKRRSIADVTALHLITVDWQPTECGFPTGTELDLWSFCAGSVSITKRKISVNRIPNTMFNLYFHFCFHIPFQSPSICKQPHIIPFFQHSPLLSQDASVQTLISLAFDAEVSLML